MMKATKTYSWGEITVTFEARSNADAALVRHVLDAHTSIQKTLDMLAILTEPEQAPARGTPKPFNPNCVRCVDSDGGICAFHASR